MQRWPASSSYLHEAVTTGDVKTPEELKILFSDASPVALRCEYGWPFIPKGIELCNTPYLSAEGRLGFTVIDRNVERVGYQDLIPLYTCIRVFWIFENHGIGHRDCASVAPESRRCTRPPNWSRRA